MYKGHCAGCPHKDYCFERGDCQAELTRKKLGIVEYAQLSEIREVSELDPEGDQPILYYNPLEKDDDEDSPE